MKAILNENYYDVDDVAKMLGITIIPARKLFQHKKISGVIKIGRSYHVSETNFKNYLQQSNIKHN